MRKFEVGSVRINGHDVRRGRFTKDNVQIVCENVLTSSIEVGLFCREWWLFFDAPYYMDDLRYAVFRPKLRPRWLFVSFAGPRVEEVINTLRSSSDKELIVQAVKPLLEYTVQQFKPAEKRS